MSIWKDLLIHGGYAATPNALRELYPDEHAPPEPRPEAHPEPHREREPAPEREPHVPWRIPDGELIVRR